MAAYPRSFRTWPSAAPPPAGDGSVAGAVAGTVTVRVGVVGTVTVAPWVVSTRSTFWRGVQVRVDLIRLNVAGERAPPRHQLVGHGAQRIDVARTARRLAARLLGGDVAGGAHHRAGHRHGRGQRVNDPGDAEVGNVHRA